MDRRDPYIGDGTPPPTREERAFGERRGRSPLAWIFALAVLAAIAAAAWYFLGRERPPPPPPPQAAVVPSAAPPAVAQPPRHPVETAPAEQPLPALKSSDGPVSAALASLVGLEAFGKLFLTENLVRNIVAAVDNLPREKISRRVNPLQPVAGTPVTEGKAATLALAPANSQRYAAHMRLLATVSTPEIAAFYRRHYPLFQQAYVELGYPDGYFNDRVVEVIDHLLETPEPAGPIRLTQPKVLYEFADPALEERSAGQKAMLRIGKDNRARVKAKLREIRAAIAAS
jgi:hypothetical protein